MPREYRDYLEDILDSIDKVERYTSNLDFDDFVSDDRTKDAVVRNLEVIGEAVKNIPDDVKEKNPDIDWKNIAGLRDILIHAYFGIDNDIVWDVVENKIPELREEIERLISKLD